MKVREEPDVGHPALKASTYSKRQWLFYSVLSVAVVSLMFLALHIAIVYWIHAEPRGSVLVLSVLATTLVPALVGGIRLSYYSMLQRNRVPGMRQKAEERRLLELKSIGLIIVMIPCNFYGMHFLLRGELLPVSIPLVAVSWTISYRLMDLLMSKVLLSDFALSQYGFTVGNKDSGPSDKE